MSNLQVTIKSPTDWESLSAQHVSDHMSFEKGNPRWQYNADPSTQSSQDKQAEGVAYLWNLLGNEGIALLADEVGMGKTFQAIGLIRYLLLKKLDAKVLVIAPNKNICQHWTREFESFEEYHWKLEAKRECETVPDLAPVHASLPSLVSSIKTQQHNVFFTTVHAFSGLAQDQGEGVNRVDFAAEEAKRLNAEVLTHIGEQGFDLLVVDEAHYLRTRAGGSQKVAAASAFFGEQGKPIAQKVLLMTATPTHSSSKDVENILRYFAVTKDVEGVEPRQLLKRYALRRFRLLNSKDGNHVSKQSYRKECLMPVSFEGNPNAELFFAQYQRALVHKLNMNGSTKQCLYGYLEGFESFGENISAHASYEEAEQDGHHTDFHSSLDSEILYRLSQQYYEYFSEYPEHPKYNTLVSSIVPEKLSHQDLEDIKHLVFVRRIPSVRELTKRVNAAYDDLLGERVASALGLKNEVKEWKKTRWSRQWLNRRFANVEEAIEQDDDEGSEENDDNRLTSRVAELFVVKKKGTGEPEEYQNTICTNLGLRFRKPESVFSLFLEPASDYYDAPYQHYYEHRSKERLRPYYSTAAADARLGREGEDLLGEYLRPMHTIWPALIERLPQRLAEKYLGWVRHNTKIVENFANYFKAGVLFASPVIVELFEWYMRFERTVRNEGSAEHRYLAFLNYVCPKLDDSKLLWYFRQSIETFEEVCDKISGVRMTDCSYEWRSLKSLSSPAAFASGATSNRERLILGFNSPFYPHVLVATSVFQEGVNLHMQCSHVHHYGLAGSPGDHEQRVGRLDRLYGKVNRQLLEHGEARLEINFPYLAGSFDEDQLASFLEKKHKANANLDAGLLDNSDGQIGTGKADNWQAYLFSPKSQETVVDDPYPAVGV